jgi:hypothetical protein
MAPTLAKKPAIKAAVSRKKTSGSKRRPAEATKAAVPRPCSPPLVERPATKAPVSPPGSPPRAERPRWRQHLLRTSPPDWMRLNQDGLWTWPLEIGLQLPRYVAPEGHRWVMDPENARWVLQQFLPDDTEDE